MGKRLDLFGEQVSRLVLALTLGGALSGATIGVFRSFVSGDQPGTIQGVPASLTWRIVDRSIRGAIGSVVCFGIILIWQKRPEIAPLGSFGLVIAIQPPSDPFTWRTLGGSIAYGIFAGLIGVVIAWVMAFIMPPAKPEIEKTADPWGKEV